jgi:hypothetical protein
MTTRWRNLTWTAFLACGAFIAPAMAQDEDAPKKKAPPKEGKTASPLLRPQKKTPAPPEPGIKEEIAVQRGDPTNLDEAWRAIDREVNFGTPEESRRLIALMMRRPDFTPEALVELRERYGSSMLIRIASMPELGDLGRRFLQASNDATRAKLRDAERIKHFIGNLEKSPSEQAFAINELRKSGEVVAPFLAEAILANPNKPVYAQALAQMPPRLWEAVAVLLDSGTPLLHSAALDALATYRVKASAEALYYPLASKKYSEEIQSKAQYALGTLGRLVTPPDAIPALVVVAEDYYLGRGGREINEPHDVWSWKDAKLVVTSTPAAEAAYQFALDAAKKAYDLDAKNISAQTILASILLSKPNVRAFPPEFQALNDSAILSRVVAQAEIDRRGMTARNAVAMLGLKDDAEAFKGLIAALNYPNTEVQFMAAQAVLRLKPKSRFPGYDRIVPILIRALRAGEARSAVIGDGSPSRANQTGNLLRGVGYRPRIAGSGREAFKLASEYGDVELIVLEATIGDPNLNDTLTQLRLDARTSGIPVVVFEIDPPDYSPPVVLRPLTEVEKETIRRKQDHQAYLEQARTELYARATTQPEREVRRFRSYDERVDYLLKRMGYVSDPAEYKRLMADIPDHVVVPAPVLLDPLEIREIRNWYAERAENLSRLRERHPNVILMPRVDKPETFAKGLRLFAPGEDGGLLSNEARATLQTSAINWLKRIATGEFPYLDVRPAAPMLASLLVEPKMGPVAADALGLVPSPFAQGRLADVALAGTQPIELRAAALNNLAASVTRVGRLFTNRIANDLLLIGAVEIESPLGKAVDAIAKALGPAAEAILARHRAGAVARPTPKVVQPAPANAAPVPKAPPKKEKKADEDF